MKKIGIAALAASLVLAGCYQSKTLLLDVGAHFGVLPGVSVGPSRTIFGSDIDVLEQELGAYGVHAVARVASEAARFLTLRGGRVDQQVLERRFGIQIMRPDQPSVNVRGDQYIDLSDVIPGFDLTTEMLFRDAIPDWVRSPRYGQAEDEAAAPERSEG